MGTIRFIAFILMFALPATAQPVALTSEQLCVRGDTLDPLPEWNYCEIVAGLDTSLSYLFPIERIHWEETYEVQSVSLTLDSMRLLAWCVRETISDHRKHGMDIRKYYQDLALIWVWFRYDDTSQLYAPVIVMKRDTNAWSMDHSWRYHSVDSTVSSLVLPHPSIRYFTLPLYDGNAPDKAANELLSILFRGDSLTFNGEVRNTLQRGAIRSKTWKRWLGSDLPVNVHVD
jgi:hypothetical protein